MLVYRVIRDLRSEVACFVFLHDPVVHLVAGSIFLALAKVAHRVDCEKSAVTRLLCHSPHLIELADENWCHRISKSHILDAYGSQAEPEIILHILACNHHLISKRCGILLMPSSDFLLQCGNNEISCKSAYRLALLPWIIWKLSH